MEHGLERIFAPLSRPIRELPTTARKYFRADGFGARELPRVDHHGGISRVPT